MARRILLALTSAIIATTSLLPAATAEELCPEALQLLDICTILADGTVQWHATLRTPDQPRVPRAPVRPLTAEEREAAENRAREEAYIDALWMAHCESVFAEPELCTPEAIPGLTAEDFLALAPAGPALASEPGTFALLNLPTNFRATATTHQRSGTLLGGPVTAEFTPIAYTWDYGDGTTHTTDHPGTTWAGSHLEEFAETPTSHTYRAKGTYTTSTTVHYAVTATFNGGTTWTAIPGTLPIASTPHPLTVYTINTVLVDEDCNENPTGPGC